MDGTEARKPGARRLAVRRERLDEHRHGGKPVGKDELSHGLRFAHAARELDHLVEAWQLGIDAPARKSRGRRGGVLHPPAGGGMARLHHVRGDAPDVELGERELLYRVAGGVHGRAVHVQDRKSTRLNSSHTVISYAVFCLKKKKDDYAVLPQV